MKTTHMGFAALTAILVLSGCKETKIVDGKIPAGYEQYARQAEGTYAGKISKHNGGSMLGEVRSLSLDVKFVNDRIVLTPNRDWLGQGCDSKIGNLVSVQTSGQKLKTAVFAFNPGKCGGPRLSPRLVVRMFDQSTSKPKLVAWVETDWNQYNTEAGIETETIEMRANLRKQ